MIGGRQAARPTSDRDALVPAVMRRSRAAGNAPWDPDPELEMPAPFRWTAVLFAALGALAALDAALVGLGLVPTHAGLLWLRVHLVTLGLLAELAFGLLPGLVALATGGAVPVFRPGRWLLLNLGLLTLLVGIPLVRRPMIALGGTLVLAATVWLILELWRQRPAPAPDAGVSPRPADASTWLPCSSWSSAAWSAPGSGSAGVRGSASASRARPISTPTSGASPRC